MPRFFINKKNIFNNTIIISGDESRHILKVLRLKLNDLITLFDAEGTAYESVINAVRKDEVTAQILKTSKNSSFNTSEMILAQAVLKAKKMDIVVQKSIELGISRIIPFFTSRTIPKWTQKKCAEKVDHWNNIVTASIKQSGIRKMPHVDPIISFDELVSSDIKMHKLVLYEKEKKSSLKNVINNIRLPSDIIIMVGPEGGFAVNEINKAIENGFITAGIGNLILRAETVPITVLSILQYEAGNLG